MGCAGNHKGDWCRDLPLRYRDEEGNGYCLFHTPQRGRRWLEEEPFDLMVMDRIKEAAARGEACNLSGALFDRPLHLDGLTLPALDLSGARFFEEVTFRGTRFSGSADFDGAVFHKGVDFEAALFQGGASFRRTLFQEMPDFFDTLFMGEADFSGAFFRRGAFFTWGAFRAPAHFTGTRYGGRVIFKRPAPA